jgi:hypothetical protein
MAVGLCFTAITYGQRPEFPEARNLVQRVQEDLRHSVGFATPEIKKDRKQIERWDNAQRSLSNFDKHLSEGKFDKGELDAAINDLKNVFEHNTLSSQDRDILNRDLADLRRLRADRG